MMRLPSLMKSQSEIIDIQYLLRIFVNSKNDFIVRNIDMRFKLDRLSQQEAPAGLQALFALSRPHGR